MNIYEVIKRPIITEKSQALAEQGKYVFEVDKRANKTQIKEAVEKIFGVKVVKVNVIKLPPKWKRVGNRYVIKRKEMKKAIVTLRPGDKIQIFEGV